MNAEIAMHECIMQELCEPVKAETMFIGDMAIDFDLYVTQFSTTTYNFTGISKNNFHWRYAIKQEKQIKSLVIKMDYETLITGIHGELRFASEIHYFLPPEKLLTSSLMVTCCVHAGKELLNELRYITAGFKQNNNLKIGVSTIEKTKRKCQTAIEKFLKQ